MNIHVIVVLIVTANVYLSGTVECHMRLSMSGVVRRELSSKLFSNKAE